MLLSHPVVMCGRPAPGRRNEKHEKMKLMKVRRVDSLRVVRHRLVLQQIELIENMKDRYDMNMIDIYDTSTFATVRNLLRNKTLEIEKIEHEIEELLLEEDER